MSLFSSFRDPNGRVFFDDASIWRLVSPEGTSDLETFLGFPQAKKWQDEGRLIATAAASKPDEDAFAAKVGRPDSSWKLFRHDRVDFPSYPYEWAPEMLEAAGSLTLDLADALLPINWGLKDGTPFNVLFQGATPVFVDLLSFEKRDPQDPIWTPLNQYVQTFLLPLLLNKKLGIPLKSIFQSNRDGIEVTEASRYFGAFAKLVPQIFSLVTLPNMLRNKAESKSDLYQKSRKVSESQAKFVLGHNFRRLRRQLAKVSPDPGRQSKWTSYTDHNRDTIPAYMSAKQNFVEQTVAELRPKTVLDVGCNTGYFSFFAARSGASVVALDHDPAVVGQVWRDARKEDLNVLPLVVDLSRPSPSMGWRYSETPSFLDRAMGKFDLVMMLAVLHHMIVQERIPLREVVKLAADLTTDAAIIEFVPPADPLFRRLARGRDHLHADLNSDVFEQVAQEFFTIVGAEPLPQTERVVYLLRKK